MSKSSKTRQAAEMAYLLEFKVFPLEFPILFGVIGLFGLLLGGRLGYLGWYRGRAHDDILLDRAHGGPALDAHGRVEGEGRRREEKGRGGGVGVRGEEVRLRLGSWAI